MGEFDLNLSTRPFPAYRLINLILLVAFIAVAAVSAWQVYGFMHYSGLSAGIRQQEQDARIEAEELTRRRSQLETQMSTPAAAARLSEIGYLNKLISRKAFSWTQVFATLEKLTPPNVRLASIRPEFADNGPIVMRMNVRGQNIAAVSEFIDALEKSDAFEGVVVSVEQKQEADVDITISVNYFPEKASQ